MSDDHKAALAQGRRESKAIKSYLSALGSRRPGRPVTPETIKQRIDDVAEKLDKETDPLRQVGLRQERLDLEQKLEEFDQQEDVADLEAGFVEHAASYAERKGISYPAWRDSGVPASVLKKAAIPRTRR
ncbi:MAG: hypothetical protein GEU79_02495 [Acidimicrobiia bacterium]|nr:hypothetical protein [Acidimicrobiia bacterium]